MTLVVWIVCGAVSAAVMVTEAMREKRVEFDRHVDSVLAMIDADRERLPRI